MNDTKYRSSDDINKEDSKIQFRININQEQLHNIYISL